MELVKDREGIGQTFFDRIHKKAKEIMEAIKWLALPRMVLTYPSID
jgi:hypothetical protein